MQGRDAGGWQSHRHLHGSWAGGGGVHQHGIHLRVGGPCWMSHPWGSHREREGVASVRVEGKGGGL